VIRDRFIAAKRHFRIYSVDDAALVKNLQKAADWLTAHKVLPESVTVADHLAQA
jgi:sulfonate transport system substrate-binding protein